MCDSLSVAHYMIGGTYERNMGVFVIITKPNMMGIVARVTEISIRLPGMSVRRIGSRACFKDPRTPHRRGCGVV